MKQNSQYAGLHMWAGSHAMSAPQSHASRETQTPLGYVSGGLAKMLPEGSA